MSFGERLAVRLRPAFHLGRNPVTLTGAVLTTSAGVTLVVFWTFELLSAHPTHPYAGILFFLILPTLFALGLALMPLGALWHRHRLRRRGELPETYPRIDLADPVFRRGAALVALATFVNIAIMGTASYRGVEYMDSTQFCGLTCHKVMAPEYTAFSESPHSRISCVECHIGPGAPWFVKSKLSGVRQVFAVALDTYSKPIHSPVKDLRPARETCEQCHWPQKFHGDKFVVRTKYREDEANTAVTTVLVLKIGGRTHQGSVGIHGRHLDDRERIEYVATDDRRQVIPQVTYRDDAGKSVLYASTETKPTPEQLARGEHRSMDCMDCHNRPSHAFELPERALDRALAEGRISPTLPYVKKTGVTLLRAEYPDRATAAERIAAGVVEFYRTAHPQTYRDHRALVETAAAEVKAIYLRNVFPGMKVGWGTYPNNIGHEDFLGCFRCHDESHQSADGKTISQDCNACHTVLAMEESNPKVLADLGLR
jgi:nitrate/TMAO reductase-like tetraheme cytochrome c subunit